MVAQSIYSGLKWYKNNKNWLRFLVRIAVRYRWACFYDPQYTSVWPQFSLPAEFWAVV